MKIIADQNIPFVKDYFANCCGELILKSGRDIVSEDVKDADILLVRSVTRVDANLLKNSKVKFVGSVTAGMDHVDMNWLNEAHIAVANAHGFNAPPVADYVMSVIASLITQKKLLSLPAKAAVIGVGNVGKIVVKRLQALGVHVMVCDPWRAMQEPNFVSMPLQDIADVDLISLHVPLAGANHEYNQFPTYHLIEKNFLQRQKPNCILINSSRGAVIDSNALLQSGTHLRWCFDVWEHEPAIKPKILRGTDIATPHIAGYSVQSKTRGIEMIYEVLKRNGFIANSRVGKSQSQETSASQQILSFAHKKVSWMDVVLTVFDPLPLTTHMKQQLLPLCAPQQFDAIRHEVKHRYEFSAIQLKDVVLAEVDRNILIDFGFVLLPS